MSHIGIFKLLENLTGNVVISEFIKILCLKFFVCFKVPHHHHNSVCLMNSLNLRVPPLEITDDGGNCQNDESFKVIFSKVVAI